MRRSEVDRGEGLHFARCVAAGIRIAVAELTINISSPALDGVVVEERARVLATGGDLLGGVILAVGVRAEVDRGEVVAHFVRGPAAPSRIAVAEPTVNVGTPALDGVVVEERTRVTETGGDLLGGATVAEGDRGEAVAHLA